MLPLLPPSKGNAEEIRTYAEECARARKDKHAHERRSTA